MAGPIVRIHLPPGPAECVIRRVGVVGLGHMGHAFAINLAEDGYQVSVYDRDPKRIAALTEARPISQLADLAARDVVVTSLPDDDALADVALGPEGLARILAPNAVHISTSTVSPPLSRRVAEEHARPSSGLRRRAGSRESGLCTRQKALRSRRRRTRGAGK